MHVKLIIATAPRETVDLIVGKGRGSLPFSCSTEFKALARSPAVSARVPSRSKRTVLIMAKFYFCNCACSRKLTEGLLLNVHMLMPGI